jgi:hypothetical protein
MLYEELWLSMRAQRTILDSLGSKTASLAPLLTSPVRDALVHVSVLIETLLTLKVVRLFEAADNALATVQKFVDLSATSPEAEKLINTFVNAMLAINRIASALGTVQSEKTESPVTEANPTEPASRHIVCRICDEPIPTELFERHTQSCLTLYSSQKTVSDLNEKMREVQHAISENTFSGTGQGLSVRRSSTCFRVCTCSF